MKRFSISAVFLVLFVLLAGCSKAPDSMAGPVSEPTIEAYRRGASITSPQEAELAAMQDAMGNAHFRCTNIPTVIDTLSTSALTAHQKMGLPGDDYLAGGLDVCEMVWLVSLQCDVLVTPPEGGTIGEPAQRCVYVIIPKDKPESIELGSTTCPDD